MNTDPHTPRATPPRRDIPPPRHISTARTDHPTTELHDPTTYADAQRLATKREQTQNDTPSTRYTTTTLTVAAAALTTWGLLIWHVADHHRHTAIDPLLGTHQVLCATLTITAACLGIGWAMMRKECDREKRRDEIAHLRHRRELAEIKRLFDTVLREGDLGAAGVLAGAQRMVDAAVGGEQPEHRNVRRFPPRGRS